MAEGGEDLKEVVVTPTSEQGGFEEMFKFLEAMKVNPKGEQQQKLASMMKEFLKSTGQLDETKPKDKKPPPLKQEKKPTGLPPPPAFISPHNTMPSVSMSHQPKLSCFSGTPNKGESTYDVWRYNVRCLLKENIYRPDVLHSTIRQSLRNEAARVVMRLGTDATMDQILHKLDSIYGNVDKKEELMAEFYGARQREDEDITSWSCRLEDIIGKAQELGLVQHEDVEKMLHSMLWTGLRQELKDVSSHKYDTVKGFDELRVALRQVEKDHLPQKTATTGKGKSNMATSKSAVTKEEKSQHEELKGMINQLMKKVTNLEGDRKTQQQFPPPQQNRGRGNFRGYGNRRGGYHQPRTNNWQKQPYQANSSQPWATNQTYQQNTSQPWKNNQTYQRMPSQTWSQQSTSSTDQGIQCRRCGQYGHIQIGCRVRLDHLRSDLNAKKPTTQGHS